MNTELLKWAEAQANLFRTFNNAYRILILCALDDKEMSVGEIASEIEASVQNTSQHLQVMKDRGILISRRDGQTIFYRMVNQDLLKECGLTPPGNP
jgi:ArsR family transcriptional regulator, virulence genes transcriptional regulator